MAINEGAAKRGWLYDKVNARLNVYVDGSNVMQLAIADHIKLNSIADGKTVRINSRNYTQTSGDSIAGQSKPNQTVAGTASVYGWQFSPRFADAIGGNSLVGVQSNPILKGSTGNLTGDYRCFEAKLETEGGAATRTITGVSSCFRAEQQLSSGGTYTGGVYALEVKAKVNNKVWDGLALLPDDSEVAEDALTATDSTKRGWIAVTVGSASRFIRLYDSGI